MITSPELNITLLLVRHGHTIWNDTGGVAGRSDIDLSKYGEQSVSALATSWSENTTLDSFYSSPLLRTMRTTQLLREGLSHHAPFPQLVTDRRLVELDFGDWEGMTWQSVHEQYQQQMEQWGQDWINRSPPNGESFSQQAARCDAWLQSLVSDLRDVRGDHTAMVVLHGGSIRALVCLCLGWSLERGMGFSVDPASVTSLQLDQGNGRWMARMINSSTF